MSSLFVPQASSNLDTRSPNMTQDITRFSEGKVYIVDDIPDYDDAQSRVDAAKKSTKRKRAEVTEHEHNCMDIRDTFTAYTEYKVIPVTFPKGAKSQHFAEFWKHEISKWTEDTLAIIFYHGDAGGEDEDYSWYLPKDPGQIKVLPFFKQLSESKATKLILADCFIQDRFSTKWDDKRQGAMEIIARPERMQRRDRKAVSHDGDFTVAFASNMEEYVENIKTKFKNSRALRSIPNILAMDETMYSNPKRIMHTKTRAGNKEVIKRLVVDPVLIRLTGKFEFFAKQIQGGADIQDLVRFEALHEDEGFDEGEGEPTSYLL